MHSIVLAVALGTLVIVAYEDVRTRRIPNALSLATAILGLARVALTAEVIDAGYTLVAASIIFTITFALFQRVATLATEGLDLYFGRFRRGAHVSSAGQSDRGRVASKGSTVPYGVAVAAAGVITLIAAR